MLQRLISHPATARGFIHGLIMKSMQTSAKLAIVWQQTPQTEFLTA